MLEQVFLKIIDMSRAAGIIIVIVMLARLCLKRFPKYISYMLWSVVFFRLLCPFTFESPISLVPQMEPAFDAYTSEQTAVSTLASDTPAADPDKESNAPENAWDLPSQDAVSPDAAVWTTPVETGMAANISWQERLIRYGKYVWLAGIAALLFYSVVSVVKIRRRVSEAIPLRENIYITDGTLSPFVMGIGRPRIYLPESLTEKEREYIILHEQFHIRRFDHIVKPAAFAAVCIHWFNPLAWLAFILFSRDMEMSCDEAVIQKMGDGIRADYSASLLALSTRRRIIRGFPVDFGEGDTKGRIRNLAAFRKTKKGVLAVLLTAAVLLIVCLASTRKTLLSAGNDTETESSTAVYDAPEAFHTSFNITEYLMAQGAVSFGIYEGYTIRLVMTEGEYYSMEEMDPGGGTYADNYNGQYVLRLLDAEETILDELSLNEDWGYERISFPGEFELCIGDYNADRLPDFTIGTYGSSIMNIFWLYSINEDGKIVNIADKTGFSYSASDFSIALAQEEGSTDFYTHFYNNVLGEEETVTYRWEEAAWKYAEVEEEMDIYEKVIASAEDILAGNDAEHRNEYGISSVFYMDWDYETLGYLIEDIDGNGIRELILGANTDGWDDGGWDGIIYDMYTISDGALVHVLDGWERCRYYLCENGRIANESSGSAMEYEYNYLRFQDAELILVESVIYDGRWFYCTTGQADTLTGELIRDPEDSASISEAQAQAIMDSYVHQHPVFLPFDGEN